MSLIKIRNAETGAVAVIEEKRWKVGNWNGVKLAPPTWVRDDGKSEKSEPEVAPVNSEAKVDDSHVAQVLSREEVEDLSWQELKRYASSHNVNTKKLTKDEVIQSLDNVGAIASVGDEYEE